MRILVFAALKNEVKYILRKGDRAPAPLECRSAGRDIYTSARDGKEIIIALTGMGVKNAEIRAGELLRAQRPDLVLSIGFAGALYENARHGDIVCPEKAFLHPGAEALEISGPDFDSLFAGLAEKTASPPGRGPVITLSKWVEKPALKNFPSPRSPEETAVCDMETFALAATALKSGLRFFAIRAVSDKLDEEIQFDPLEIADPNGYVSVPRAALKFIKSPRLLPKAMGLRKSSDIAARSLARALSALIESL